MRQILDPQLELGEQDISRILLDTRPRDDIPQVLRALQYIDVTPEVREQVFAILAAVLPRSCILWCLLISNDVLFSGMTS